MVDVWPMNQNYLDYRGCMFLKHRSQRKIGKLVTLVFYNATNSIMPCNVYIITLLLSVFHFIMFVEL